MSNVTNADAIVDFLFCPEYEWKKRESNTKSIDTTAFRQRYEKRQHLYNKYLELQHLVKKKGGKRRQPIHQQIYFFIQNWRVKRLQKRTQPNRLLAEERKVNSNLTLLDYREDSNGIFADIRNVTWKNGHFVITLDRTNVQLPSYAPYIRHSDLLALVIQMNLIHTNFFTENIKGIITYENHKPKEIKWSDSKVNAVQREIKSVAKKIHQTSKKKIPSYPFRCEQCEFQTVGCEKNSSFPELKLASKADEDIEKTYHDFRKGYAKLFQTYWQHWDKDIRALAKVINTSGKIKNIIDSHQNGIVFNIEEMVLTSTIHKKEIFNRFLSTKNEFTFSYQFLLYLSQTGKVGKVKKLIRAYGITQKYDYRTHPDILVQNFFQKIFRNFIDLIDNELKGILPANVVQTIQNMYHFDRSQVNFAYDEGTIQATMTLEDFDEEEDEE